MSRWKIIDGLNLYFITTTIVEWQYVFIRRSFDHHGGVFGITSWVGSVTPSQLISC